MTMKFGFSPGTRVTMTALGTTLTVQEWNTTGVEPTSLSLKSDLTISAPTGATVLYPADYAGSVVGADTGSGISYAASPRVAGTLRAGETIQIVRGIPWYDDLAGALDFEWRVYLDSTQIATIVDDPGTVSIPFTFGPYVTGASLTVIEAVRQNSGPWVTSSSGVQPFSSAPALQGKDRFLSDSVGAVSINGFGDSEDSPGFTYSSPNGTNIQIVSSSTVIAANAGYATRSDPVSGNHFAATQVERGTYAGGLNPLWIGPAVRVIGVDATTFSAYFVIYNAVSNEWQLCRKVGANNAETVASAPNLGFGYDKAEDMLFVTIGAVGSLIRVWLDDKEAIAFTDPSPLLGGAPGLVSTGNVGSNAIIYQFAAGDI